MQLKFKRLHPDAILPKLATAGAACFDLHALLGGEDARAYVNVGTSTTLRTGFAVEIPEGFAMLIYSRSGHGFNKNVRLANCVGVIDSDYRGELMVKLTRDEHDGGEMVVRHGDRIAQAMLMPVPLVELMEVDHLTATVRGTGGLGSTGA